MSVSIYLAIPLMILLGLLETAVLPHIPLFGTTLQLSFLVALAWGLVYGLEEGVVWAFFAGILTVLFSITLLSVSSLSFLLRRIAVLWFKQALPASHLLLPAALAALATIVTFILNLLLLRLFNTISDFQSITILPTMLLINLLAILPLYWFLFLIDRSLWPRRVRL